MSYNIRQRLDEMEQIAEARRREQEAKHLTREQLDADPFARFFIGTEAERVSRLLIYRQYLAATRSPVPPELFALL